MSSFDFDQYLAEDDAAIGRKSVPTDTPVARTTAIKGRGHAVNPDGRFSQRSVSVGELADIDSADHGAPRLEPELEFEPAPGQSAECFNPPHPETVLTPMRTRSIVSSNASPDIPFDRSINPYVGCEHGCAYCYARPSHSYLDLSPGLDFETKIFYKPDACDRLLETWQKPGYTVRPISIGANTDPYQPAEKRLGLTRSLLQLFLKHRHPVSLITKGTLMRRDLDLLGELAEAGLASVAVSIPTADNALKRILEPRVPAARERFRLVEDLKAHGVPVTVMMAPIIPALNDREIETIVASAANAGADDAAWILLRLPHELKALFRQWLDTHYPERADHVISILRQASGGKDYDNRFGTRQRGTGVFADLIARRFDAARKRHDLGKDGRADGNRWADCSQFEPPGARQLGLPW